MNIKGFFPISIQFFLFFLIFISTIYSVSAQSDNCTNAILITPSFSSCNYRGGSSLNATQSKPGCSGNADDDVWYYFIANSADMIVKVDPTGGYDAVFELYRNGCNGVSLGCRDLNSTGISEEYRYSSLTIGQAYYLRIYHYGVGSGTNNFRVCVSGVPQPTNKQPCTGFLLPLVTPACQYQTFKTENHTGSGVSSPSCASYAGGDFWFKVIVPTSGKLEIYTQALDITDGGMALYKKSSQTARCDSGLTLISCNDDGGFNYMPYIYSTGNTPGDTMFIRFWEYGNNVFGKFNICVSTPDNDSCHHALEICDLNGYSSTTSDKYPIDKPGNMESKTATPPGPFGAGSTDNNITIDNNSWLTFTAADTTASLTIEIEDCWEGDGLQIQIFSGNNCDNFQAVSNFIQSSSSQILTAHNLVIGSKYYVVVDGIDGDVCSYTIKANTGVSTISILASDTNICIGSSVNLTAQLFGTGSFTYTWTSIPANGSYPNTASINVTPTVTTEYFLAVTGLCGDLVESSIIIYVDTPISFGSISVSSDTICPNSISTINSSNSSLIYTIYNNRNFVSPIGTTPFVYRPNGFLGDTIFYVTLSADNACMENQYDSIIITSLDTTAPIINCPNNSDRFVNSSCNYIVENFTNSLTITDNCYNSVTNILQNPLLGTILSGANTIHTITLTAKDSSGNISTCNFDITLKDTISPIIQCPNDTVLYLNQSCYAIVPNFRGLVNYTDNCTSNSSLVYTQIPAAGTSIFGATSTPVIISIRDASNNIKTCTFSILTRDTIAPLMDCPSLVRDTITSQGTCEYRVGDYRNRNYIEDNCDGNSSLVITQNPPVGTILDLNSGGITQRIELVAFDNNGNQSFCFFDLHAVCKIQLIIPEFISPNGDGLNDVLFIENLDQHQDNYIQIFNRWGSKVYEKYDYKNDWNGTLNGSNKKLPSGTYYYILIVNDKDNFTGFVQIRE